MQALQLASQANPEFQPIPADGAIGGVPVPVGAKMFGVQGGKIYRFSSANDTTDRDYVEGGLEFYGLKGISRFETESKDNKYGLLSYVRFHFVSPFKGLTYCLQLSDGANRDGSATCPPAHIRGLVQSLLKAKRELEPRNLSMELMPGVIAPRQGDDPSVTFLNLFVGPDPYDTNSLVQVFCEEEERLEKNFEAFDAAIDELCAYMGQETPSGTAEEAADAINVSATTAEDLF